MILQNSVVEAAYDVAQVSLRRYIVDLLTGKRQYSGRKSMKDHITAQKKEEKTKEINY